MKLSTRQNETVNEAYFPARVILEGMISSMREGVVIVDGNMSIFASNPAARVLLARDEIDSTPLSDVVENDIVDDAFRRALENGQRAETKVEIDRNRNSRVYDLRIAPISFAEKEQPELAIGIFYDITRLERLEKVRQEFLSNVSHELRTPLTSILAFVETLENGALEDKDNNRRFLGVIRRNAERMHHLIDDILELSAIEAGKINVHPKHVQLAPLVDEVWSTLSKKAIRRNISFKNEVPDGTAVFADAHRLEQILINLLGNALKFNRENGTVSVSYSKNDRFHEIQVSDSGEGIPPEHLPRIFERFYRTDTARSRELGGTGLGLAIVKHLVRLHDGEVRVRSSEGKGSVFTVELAVRRD